MSATFSPGLLMVSAKISFTSGVIAFSIASKSFTGTYFTVIPKRASPLNSSIVPP